MAKPQVHVKNRNIIPISALITLGTITMSNIHDDKGLFSTREIVGFLVLFTMLSAGADLGIPIAGGFAVLVMITVLLVRGDKALQFVVGKTEEKRGNSKGKANRGNRENGQSV